jgi:hypothetical protein
LKRKVSAALVVISACVIVGSVTAKPRPSAGSPEAADKVVVITPATGTIDVVENETVLFKAGGKLFTVKFGSASGYYDLGTLAPPGILTRKVKVYVAPR